MTSDAGPSLVKRVLAGAVLVVVAILALRIVVGFLAGIFWLVALAVLVVAGLWAWSTLRAGKRRRAERKVDRRVTATSPAHVPPPAREDRVEAQLQQLKEQLRQQGRL